MQGGNIILAIISLIGFVAVLTLVVVDYRRHPPKLPEVPTAS
jgi:hypothetical protein